jgi:hypothetical protein
MVGGLLTAGRLQCLRSGACSTADYDGAGGVVQVTNRPWSPPPLPQVHLQCFSCLIGSVDTRPGLLSWSRMRRRRRRNSEAAPTITCNLRSMMLVVFKGRLENVPNPQSGFRKIRSSGSQRSASSTFATISSGDSISFVPGFTTRCPSSRLRRSRYIGLDKTRLQHVATAAALNLIRLSEWCAGTPLAKTRCSRFAALQRQGIRHPCQP